MSLGRTRTVVWGETFAYSVPVLAFAAFTVLFLTKGAWLFAAIFLLLCGPSSLRARQRLSRRGGLHAPPILEARQRLQEHRNHGDWPRP